MNLQDLESNGIVVASIEPIMPGDLKWVKKAKEFGFDWSKYSDSEVYKLIRVDTKEILGMLAIKAHPQFGGYIEIVAVETGQGNVGHEKKIDRIGACMIAWACRQSFIRGFNGFVQLIPKTDLIEHYIKKYGMQRISSRSLYIGTQESKKLIEKYLTGG